MKLQWHGHSCFTVSHEGYAVVLDPYRMDEYPPLHLSANEVICSHEHFDHNARECVRVTPAVSPFCITTLDAFHDEVQGAKRGKNQITVLSCDGFRIAHCGDLGHALSPEQIETLRGVDVLLLPVGGVYTIDAKEAKALCDALAPRYIVPMHYRGENFGLHNLETVVPFLAQFTPDRIHRLDGDTLDLDGDLPGGIYVLQFEAR